MVKSARLEPEIENEAEGQEGEEEEGGDEGNDGVVEGGVNKIRQ